VLALGRPSIGATLERLAKRLAWELERRWDAARLARRAGQPPRRFRIEPFFGHGEAGDGVVVVRGRVLDNPEPTVAAEGEAVWQAALRTARRFLTDELPDVPLTVRVGASTVDVATDADGYFHGRLLASLDPSSAPWAGAEVELAGSYRGLDGGHLTPVRIRVPGSGANFGVISDIDDTIIHTGAQRLGAMIRRTLAGSELTRSPLLGAPELYRALARSDDADANPVFYVSSSPWNLHGFLTAFLDHHAFPLGPLLLRDLFGVDGYRDRTEVKQHGIAEVLEIHPELSFVLIGDSGQQDPEIYAKVIRDNPTRILAAFIREVRLDPGDGRVEAITDSWGEDVPIVVAKDSAAMADHAAGLGLITAEDAALVAKATDVSR
jgi:phosphatidate phosphatase APP1